MSIQVWGSKDVDVGDFVDWEERTRMRTTQHRTCKVVRVGKTGLTVQTADGVKTAGYSKIVTTRVFRTRERRRIFPFTKLTPREVWLRSAPKAVAIGPRGATSVVFPIDSFRTVAGRDQLSVDIIEISAWLYREPKE